MTIFEGLGARPLIEETGRRLERVIPGRPDVV
jgi:hypothetical protein